MNEYYGYLFGLVYISQLYNDESEFEKYINSLKKYIEASYENGQKEFQQRIEQLQIEYDKKNNPQFIQSEIKKLKEENPKYIYFLAGKYNIPIENNINDQIINQIILSELQELKNNITDLKGFLSLMNSKNICDGYNLMNSPSRNSYFFYVNEPDVYQRLMTLWGGKVYTI